jgi:ABC-2 type transport system permease protein
MKTSSTVKPISVMTTNSVFIKRSIILSIRNTEAMIMAVALPIMLMLLFTYVFGGAIDPTGHYVNYVVPGIIILCAGFGSAHTAVDVATDMTNGIIDRFRTMPIRSKNVITGHVVASLIRNLIATGVVIIVALIVGFRPSANVTEWIEALGIIILYILTFTWLYASIGIVSSTPAAASGYGFILMFLPYISSAFVQTDSMPRWLQGVAENQPITPVIETIRALLTGGSVEKHVWWAIGWCLLILICSLIWSMIAFKRKAGKR